MSESRLNDATAEISRFRAVVVAALRAKQLQRGAKPRIELDNKKHKNTSIAMEEVRRGLVSFTEIAGSHAHDSAGARDLKTGAGQFLPVAG